MRKSANLPKTDSIQKLGEFWDTHDVTEFESELEEVAKPVFIRARSSLAISVPLDRREVKAVEQLARAKGIAIEQLLRAWVLDRLAPKRNGRSMKSLKSE